MISGGLERYDSTLAALQSINEEEANLIIHDAVRPFISQKIIEECILALDIANAVDVVVDATDTIVEVSDNYVRNIPDRRYLKRGQTPQAFKKSVLEKAYNTFSSDPEKVASDDCGIVLKYLPNEKIITVPGAEENFKITHLQDIYLADNIIKDGLNIRLTHDPIAIQKSIAHKVIVIIGGNSGIGKDLTALCKKYEAKVYPLSRSYNNVDVSIKETISHALENIYSREKRIDYVINSSGLLNRKPLMTMTDEEVTNSYLVNYVGVINVARESFKYLKESHGMLINFTSSSYTRGRPNYSIYSSSKAAIVNFTQAISEEWIHHGIKVNAINPERTATPMRTINFGHEEENTLLSSIEVAQFTLSAMSFNHTGQIFSIKKNI